MFGRWDTQTLVQGLPIPEKRQYFKSDFSGMGSNFECSLAVLVLFSFGM